MEYDGHLHNSAIRETFIEQFFALQRWQETLRGRKTVGMLVGFHTCHKLLNLSHSQTIYRELGRLVASGKQIPADELFNRYELLFLKALKLKTTSHKKRQCVDPHARVFQKDAYQ